MLRIQANSALSVFEASLTRIVFMQKELILTLKTKSLFAELTCKTELPSFPLKK